MVVQRGVQGLGDGNGCEQLTSIVVPVQGILRPLGVLEGLSRRHLAF